MLGTLNTSIIRYSYCIYRASKGVSDSVISSIATNCKYIHSLSLARCTNYSSSCLENLMKHLRLKSLDISGNKQLTGASLCTISEYCTNIEFLDLSGCVNITVRYKLYTYMLIYL